MRGVLPLLGGALVATLLGACDSPSTGRVRPSLDATPAVIRAAVGRADAIERLTEATFRCDQAEPLVGLDQWICEVDNSAGSDQARYVVTILVDDDDRLRFIDAQVLAATDTGDAGRADGFASFFRDTVVGRLIPELAASDEAMRWIERHVDGAGSDDLGSVHLRVDRIDGTVRLQLSQATVG